MDFLCWCGEEKYDVFLETPSYLLGKCISCGTIRTLRGFDEEHNLNSKDGEIDAALGPRHRQSASILEKYAHGKKVLDIGCNSGLVLNLIYSHREQNKLQTFDGIDFNEAALATNKNYDLNLQNKSLKEIKTKYDNIYAFHIVEHIKNLKDFCDNVSRILKKGGIFVVAVPNIESEYAKNSPLHWPALGPEGHCWHFSLNSFTQMIETIMPSVKIIFKSIGVIWNPDDQLNIVMRKK